MGYYPILERVPKGRDVGAAFQRWLRRRDQYSSQRVGEPDILWLDTTRQ
jgi:predicted dithiol-disulfide oxidoreductase (DUF899 family)